MANNIVFASGYPDPMSATDTRRFWPIDHSDYLKAAEREYSMPDLFDLTPPTEKQAA